MQAHGVVGPAMENYVGALIAGSAGAKLTHEETALGQKLVAELQEKLRQYQEAMQGMAEQKAELRGALARQRADQKDVFEYLKAELLKKTDEVRALERRVAELDEVNHRQLREHEERSSAAAQAAADEQEELNQVVREQKLALDKVRSCTWASPQRTLAHVALCHFIRSGCMRVFFGLCSCTRCGASKGARRASMQSCRSKRID